MYLKLFVIRLRKSSIARSSFIYILASCFSAVCSFLLVTVLTHYLSREDFGIIESFNTVSTLLIAFYLWGNQAILINFYKTGSEKREYSTVFQGILAQLLLIVILFPLTLVVEIQIPIPVIIASVFYAFIHSVYTLIYLAFQLESKAMKYAFISCGVNLLTLILSLLLVFVTLSYWARILGSIAAFVIMISVFMNNFVKSKLSDYSFDFSLSGLKAFYSKGFVLFISQVASWSLEKFDRLQVLSFLSMSKLGEFAVGAQFAAGAGLVDSAITRAWQPHVIEAAQSNHRKRLQRHLRLITLILLFVICILAISIYIYIKLFIGKAYVEAPLLGALICFGYFFDGVWRLYGNIIIYENKFKFYSAVVVASALFKIIANMFLIPMYGLVGAAIATITSFFIGAAVCLFYVHVKLNWFDYENRII